MDFQTLKASEEARRELIDSETRRELQHNSNEPAHYRLDNACWLHSRIGFLRGQSKSCFSQACKAGSDKKARDEWKARAAEFQREADTVLRMLQTIEQSFGNVILAQDDSLMPWLSPCALISSLYFCHSWFTQRKVDELRTWVTLGGLAGAQPHPSEIARTLLETLPAIEVLQVQFTAITCRYFFDPNQSLRDDVLELLLLRLERLWRLKPLKHRRLVPAHRLLLASARSITLVSPSMPSLCLARVSCETEYITRQLGLRIDKQKRAKLAASPYPETFLIEIFTSDGIDFVEPESQQEEDQTIVDRDIARLGHLQKALDSRNVPVMIELAEDILENHSFLGQGPRPCVLDRKGYHLLKITGLTVPAVQYPGLHRWYQYLLNDELKFATCGEGCLCV